ncbi:MAG: hypothetical protein DCF17_16415, partial [Shackletoniella antarctica]
MAQQRNVIHLVLSLSMFCWATPSQAKPGQTGVLGQLAPGATDTPAIRSATDDLPEDLALGQAGLLTAPPST